ncbi:hypothetical protein [Bosea sp. BK604]|uniref:hypothetical protein n=1 Tax=Bosea sp. BK604 TaxID=2512180 RepID=UPI00104FE568|nr:hypothetical protein [Bosea sp. BK604]TCR65628.1 hypothetical protein EV560_105391 [Bosea sp. BK604]
MRLLLILLAALSGLSQAAAMDLVRGRTDLPELVLGNDDGDDFAVSRKEIELESGKSYRLSITAKGSKEYKFFAPELFRHIWINQIVINHLEIHMLGAPHHLEFDDQGTIHVEFVAIRPGEYPWFIQGLESKGMTGRFIVK